MGSFARKQKRKGMRAWNKGAIQCLKNVVHIDKAIHHETKKEILMKELTRQDTQANCMVIIDVAMRYAFHFGKARLLQLRKKMHTHLECIKAGYVSVSQIEDILRQEVAIDLQNTPAPGNDLISRSADQAIREMAAAFCISLLDEFGYKSKRMDKACKVVGLVSRLVKAHELTLDDLRAERRRKPKEAKTKAWKVLDAAVRGGKHVCMDKEGGRTLAKVPA